jgi:hypothetical protein
MNNKIMLRGAMSGMALAAAAAAMMSPGPSESYRPLHHSVRYKPRRAKKQADRSKKQFLLKGVRP